MQKLARRQKEAAGGDAAAARKLELQLAAAKGADLADLALQACAVTAACSAMYRCGGLSSCMAADDQ